MEDLAGTFSDSLKQVNILKISPVHVKCRIIRLTFINYAARESIMVKLVTVMGNVLLITVLLLDQGSKAAVQMWMYQGESIPIIKQVFHLTYILNPGAAFGFLAHQTNLFIIVTVGLVLGVLLFYRSLPLERVFMRYGLALVVGGALGNLVDRLRFGKVVDFLIFGPVFNLADSASDRLRLPVDSGFLKDSFKTG